MHLFSWCWVGVCDFLPLSERGRVSTGHQHKLHPAHTLSQMSSSPRLFWCFSNGKKPESWFTCLTSIAALQRAVLSGVSYSGFQTWTSKLHARALWLRPLTRRPWPRGRWVLAQESGAERLQARSGLWCFLAVLRCGWGQSKEKHQKGHWHLKMPNAAKWLKWEVEKLHLLASLAIWNHHLHCFH